MHRMSKPTKYVRICNSVKEGGKMVPLEDWHNYIKDVNTDWYRSVGTYTPEQVEKFKSQRHLLKDGAKGDGAVRGITGVKTNSLVFDFDNEDAPELSQKDALEVINRLTAMGIKSSNYNITFSGNKGFSIEIFLSKEYTSKELKVVAENLAGDLHTWDTSLYDENQILRVPGTKHRTSGLYKITLKEEELKQLNISEIKEKAKTLTPIDWIEDQVTLPSNLFVSKKKEAKPIILNKDKLNFSFKPDNMPNWKYAILNGYFPPGKRHDSMLALASYYKGMGYPMEQTVQLVLTASRLQYERYKDKYGSDPTDESELTRTIEHIYGPTWTGGIYAYEANDNLKASIMGLFPDFVDTDRDNEKTILTINDMKSSFDDFAKNIKHNKIYTGIKELDDNILLTTSMGVGLLGSPGSGKTSILLSILHHCSINNVPCMFFSLDMAQNMVFAKLISRETGVRFEDVITAFETSDPIVEEWQKALGDQFKNVGFYFRSGTSVEDMRREILKHQQKIGRKVKMVAIDYFELLVSNYGSDALANSSMVSNKIKDLTTDLDICTITLVQPPKSAGDPSQPLVSMRQVKGASTLEQNFRAIIGMYREGFNPKSFEKDKFATIVGLKNTFGPLFTVDVGWDGVRGRVYSLDAEGKKKLERLRQEKEGNEDEKEDRFSF
jgi:KaiC/GvpD/RAD55 family RecA-like ATPase